MIRKFILASALALLPSLAWAQAGNAVLNDGSTGTALNAPAKYTAANPMTAISTAGGETSGLAGIVTGWGNCQSTTQAATATTCYAFLARVGQPLCRFDASGVTSGNWVINSASANRCADSGTACTSAAPTGKDILGCAMATAAANASAQVDVTFAKYLNSSGSGSGGNPTATAGPTAINGSSTNFMRSDAAPAVQKASNAQLGIMEGDGSTISCNGSTGVCTAVGGSASSITPGTTTIVGATAPCFIANSTSTTMACDAVGSNVTGALANNLSAAGGVTSTIASGTAALGTSAISSATCASAVTVSATNVATTDVVTASFNGDPTAVTGYVPLTTGMLTIVSYPTSGNVNFKVCNNTSASITPGSITLNWRVVR